MSVSLDSKYIIDGVPRDLTPAEILAGVSGKAPSPAQGTVVDETIDPGLGPLLLDPSKTDEYLEAVAAAPGRRLSVPFAGPCTRGRIAETLIDSMLRAGNFKLDDLSLTAKWSCNPDKVGDMAAFYASVEAAADYIDTLGVSLRRYGCETGGFDARFATPFSGAPAIVPGTFDPDPESWIVYVPFDTSDYRLGGSLLSQAVAPDWGIAPQIDDPDYFMDCFEVLREFAEDGILVSARAVGAGGLANAARLMSSAGVGAGIDISDVLRAKGETDPVRILFSEIPGALFQIRDSDFDYIDAEMLLQDIAFYPLGHPSGEGLRLRSGAASGIQNILESLINYGQS